MSPFSRYFKQLRQQRGLRQNQLAQLLGYEPSYISALERSEKGPPRKEFVERLVRKLELNEIEQQELEVALKASCRQVSLPVNASDLEYDLIQLLGHQLGNLHPLQIELISIALRMPHPLVGIGQTEGK